MTNCKYCGVEFTPSVSHQKFCCESHRKKWHRKNGKASNKTPKFIEDKIGKPQDSQLVSIGRQYTREEWLIMERNRLSNDFDITPQTLSFLGGLGGYFIGGSCKTGARCKNGIDKPKGLAIGGLLAFGGLRIGEHLKQKSKERAELRILQIDQELERIRSQRMIEQLTPSPSAPSPLPPETPQVKINGDTISALDYRKADIPTIGFPKDSWDYLIGDPSYGFYMLVTGKPGQGKTTLCVKFAEYLTRYGKVVYVTSEQPNLNKAFQNLLQKFKATFDINHVPIRDRAGLEEKAKDYDFIFLDSINHIGLSSEDIKEMKTRFPRVCIVGIMQSTKDGKMRGSQDFAHECDIIIEMEKLKAIQTKSRFAPASEIMLEDLHISEKN